MTAIRTRTASEGGPTILTVSGAWDITSNHETEQWLDDAIHGTTSVIVDLTELTFIDSAAIQALFRLGHQAQIRGTRLAVVKPGDSSLAAALEIVRLDLASPLASSLDQAKGMLAAPFGA